MRAAIAVLLVALVAAGFARTHRPAPFGDALTTSRTHPTTDPLSLRLGTAAPAAVQAYDPTSGATAWSYRRPGRTPLRLVPLGDGLTVVVWDDGMLTALDSVPSAVPAVHWHRPLPVAPRPATAAATTASAARLTARHLDDALRLFTVPSARAFLAVTPGLVVGYDDTEGTIRTDTLAPSGCRYQPAAAVAVGAVPYVVAVPLRCRDPRHGTLDAFTPDGRRWQLRLPPAYTPVPLTRPDAAPALGVLGPPLLRPRPLDPATGRARTGYPLAGNSLYAAR